MKVKPKRDPGQYGSIIFETHCSNNCLFCGGIKSLSASEKKDQEETASQSLEYFISEGFQSIDISGGDPIEYEGLVSFVDKVGRSGFETIQLSTHGVGLADGDLCERLIAGGVNKFRIPIYGSKPEIHDSVTGNKGSFGATLAGIKKIIGKKVDIQISSLITEQNSSDILGMMRLMDELGVDDFYIGTPCIAKGDFSFYIPFKEIGAYLEEPYRYIIDNDKSFYFIDIPFCVFEKANFRVIRFAQPPSLGKREVGRYRVIEGVPFYRIQEKVSMCEGCRMNGMCSGFFKVDIDKFGTGKLKPLK